MKWLDTNLICHFLSDIDPGMTERARRYLTGGRERFFVSDIVLFECVYVLWHRFKLPRAEVTRALIDFIRQPFIEVAEAAEVIAAFVLWRDTEGLGSDFADCLLAERARGTGAEAVVTFDQGFEKLQVDVVVP